MENLPQTQQKTDLQSLINSPAVRASFERVLDKQAPGFISSIMSLAKANEKLFLCEPQSVLMAAAMAATLQLPINQNLGFAYIIPYGQVAQFQMGYKGYIQLAQRTGKYKTINATEVYEGELVNYNRLTGEFDLSGERTSETIIGFAAYFRLIDGFEKSIYMTVKEMQKHGSRYSKMFTSGIWKSDFDKMALKTILKMILSKYGVLSIEMQKAIISDNTRVVNIDSDMPEVQAIDAIDQKVLATENTTSFKRAE